MTHHPIWPKTSLADESTISSNDIGRKHHPHDACDAHIQPWNDVCPLQASQPMERLRQRLLTCVSVEGFFCPLQRVLLRTHALISMRIKIQWKRSVGDLFFVMKPAQGGFSGLERVHFPFFPQSTSGTAPTVALSSPLEAAKPWSQLS